MSENSPDPLSLGRLLSLVRSETGRDFDKAALLQTIGALSEALSVALLVPLIHVMGGGIAPVAIPGTDLQIAPSLPVVLAIFVVLVLVRSLALERKDTFNAKVTFGFVQKMSGRLFTALAATRWSVVSTWRTADMSYAVTGDSDRLLHTITLLLSFVQSIAMIAIFATLSLFLSPTMTLIAGLVGLVLLVATSRGRHRTASEGRKLVEARQAQFRITDEFFNGLRTAKAFGLEDRHVAAMNEMLQEIRERNVGFTVSRARSATVYQVSSAVALAGFAWFALDVVHIGVPTIIAMIFLYMRLTPRIMALHSSMQELRAQMGGVEKMLALLKAAEADAEEVEPETARPLRLRRSVELAGVSYSYPGAQRAAVTKMDAVIRAGEITAIVGPTGGGKSTVVDLVLGLIAPTEGNILIDGQPLSPGDCRSWRRKVAYVPQETFLFNATIAENLRMASPGASDEDLREALRKADAANFVEALEGGLNHRIGDRGRGLSGGERQRLAIARALLREPDLLILDEATSALDALSQRRVAQALAGMKGSLSVLIVAHRPAMVTFADHVIVMEQGSVAAAGPLDAVMASTSRHFRESIDAEQGFAYRAS